MTLETQRHWLLKSFVLKHSNRPTRGLQHGHFSDTKVNALNLQIYFLQRCRIG